VTGRLVLHQRTTKLEETIDNVSAENLFLWFWQLDFSFTPKALKVTYHSLSSGVLAAKGQQQ